MTYTIPRLLTAIPICAVRGLRGLANEVGQECEEASRAISPPRVLTASCVVHRLPAAVCFDVCAALNGVYKSQKRACGLNATLGRPGTRVVRGGAVGR